MVEIKVITKCPYCNRLFTDNLSEEICYTYKGKSVRLESHNNCGEFIAQSISGIDYHRYTISKYIRSKYIDFVENTVLYNIDDTEENIVKAVFNELSKHYDESQLTRDKADILTLIEIVIGQVNCTDIYSEKMSDIDKSELKQDCGVMLW